MHGWRKGLVEELQSYAEVYGRPAMSLPGLLDVELVLTLLHDYLPDIAPADAWVALNGHPFPALTQLPIETRRAIAITRLRVPGLLGRTSWERALIEYNALPSPYPLYELVDAGIILLSTSLLPDRLQVMRGALVTAPAWVERSYRPAPAGVARFTIGAEVHEVEIPSLALSQERQALTALPQRRPPQVFTIDLDELATTAAWMERIVPEDWVGRISRLRFHLIDQHGLNEARRYTIAGLAHLLGMVGSGKTSLFIVLAVHLARQGRRVALVQNDVARIMDLVAIFGRFSRVDPTISATPNIGRSQRIIHLDRLTEALAQEHGVRLVHDHPGFADISTLCPLDGLRRDVDPIPSGEEPCTRLYRTDSGRDVSYDCPFLMRCPTHTATRRLMKASIWLTTPAGLVAASPNEAILGSRMRAIDLIMAHTDVLLIDEADLVQIQLDEQFAQTEVLVGRSDSWLDSLPTQVSRQVYRSGRALIGRRVALDRWLNAHTNVQRAIDRLYGLLRDREDTRLWLMRDYFSADRLFKLVREEIRQQGWDTVVFDQACEAFQNAALGSTPAKPTRSSMPIQWELALFTELISGNEAGSMPQLAVWFAETYRCDPRQRSVETICHHLRITLLVGVLDHALQDMIDRWPDAAQHLELNRGSGGLFFGPAEHLARMLPEPPMGAVIGFQYWDPEGRGNGELRFFRVRAVGRALLAHIHNALAIIDEVAGPAVILASATSWAPGSWRYDLAIAPDAILRPQVHLHGTEESNVRIFCELSPITDPDSPDRPLRVSGAPPHERLRALRAMVSDLARVRVHRKKSPFDEELEVLPDHRQRIMLVVGSYEEAAEVAITLRQIMTTRGQSEDVVALARQEGPSQITRSLLSRLPALSQSRFLVVPLLAIERGYNIMVDSEAAFGSVYFLTRPLPRPGDPYTAIQRLNHWATETVPGMDKLPLGEAGRQLRAAATRRWSQELRTGGESYATAGNWRDPLIWTQLVVVWQCIGRLIRGGVDARVHFVDAAWAPVSTGLDTRSGNIVDTADTSMLVGFSTVLEAVLADRDPRIASIAEMLYGPFARGLRSVKQLRCANIFEG
jgi:hypothetical protein